MRLLPAIDTVSNVEKEEESSMSMITILPLTATILEKRAYFQTVTWRQNLTSFKSDHALKRIGRFLVEPEVTSDDIY